MASIILELQVPPWPFKVLQPATFTHGPSLDVALPRHCGVSAEETTSCIAPTAGPAIKAGWAKQGTPDDVGLLSALATASGGEGCKELLFNHIWKTTLWLCLY